MVVSAWHVGDTWFRWGVGMGFGPGSGGVGGVMSV